MKYYTEIESRFFVPINDERDINHKLDNSKLPKYFISKHQNLFDFIPKIKEMFAKLLEKNKNYNQYDKDYFQSLIRIYKKNCLNISINLNENSTLLEIRNSIQFWGKILDLIFILDNTLIEREYFNFIMQAFSFALIDIGSIDGSLAKVYLPNNWMLTSKGYLYNTQSTFHSAGFFDNYFEEKITWFLTKEETIYNENASSGKIVLFPEFSDPSIIFKNGYVKWDTLDLLLHYINYYHFNSKIYDTKMMMVATGMIELRKDLFNFLKKLELYTDSPKDNLRKVIEITNHKYLDVLIRCCGVSKITSSPHKTIVTSLLTAKTEFREYIEKGYNVCFVPPIIINKKTRMVEELNMDSFIIKEYIENEVIWEKELSSGRIYTNHLKF